MRNDRKGEGGPTPRRFEFRGDGSAKFWEVVRDDESYTVTFGRIGSTGRSQTIELDDEDEARAAVAKLVAEKLAKGYVEVGTSPLVAGTDWTTVEAWRRLRDGLQVHPARWGLPAPTPTEAEMDAFEDPHDFRLPPSYRAFLKVFGPGEFNGMFRVAVPGGPKHFNLEDLAEETRRRIEVEAIDFAADEYVELEPVTRMVVFCAWDSERWGWDRDRRDDSGEYVIRRWHRSHRVAEETAASFPEFVIEKLLLNGLLKVDDPGDPSFSPATLDEAKPPKKARAKAASPAAEKPKRRSAKEENDHLRRIAADPSDEEVRRSYAEWLGRYRDPVAEVIGAGLDGDTDLERRLAAEAAATRGEPLLALGLLPWTLGRLGARIRLDDEGRIHHIEVEDYQVNVASLREFATYPGLRELEIRAHRLTPDELDAIGGIASLAELHLHDVGLGDDGISHLARLSRLETLCLLRSETEGLGLARLKALPNLRTLVLDLAEPDRLPAHLKALASVEALRGLFLGRSELSGDRLADLERLVQIEELGLDGNPIRDEDLRRISGLEGLKILDLEDAGITGDGLVHLAGLRALEVLRTKDLPQADEAARRLTGLTSLRELYLPASHDTCSLTDEGAAHLAGLARLERLDLRWQLLTDDGLAHFAGLSALEELDLSDNRRIAGPGLFHLKGLPKLRRLRLDSTGLTAAAVPILKEFIGLEELGLWGTKIDDRGIAAIRKALPNLRD